MSPSAVRLVGKQKRGSGIVKFLLVPDLAPKHTYRPLFWAAVCVVLERLRRKRPYVVALQSEAKAIEDYAPEDLSYIQSLPRLWNVNTGRNDATYVGTGDFTPFIPRTEDDSLLFLPTPPSAVTEAGSELITRLNGVLTTQTDAFLTIQTADPYIINWLEFLPLTETISKDERLGDGCRLRK